MLSDVYYWMAYEVLDMSMLNYYNKEKDKSENRYSSDFLDKAYTELMTRYNDSDKEESIYQLLDIMDANDIDEGGRLDEFNLFFDRTFYIIMSNSNLPGIALINCNTDLIPYSITEHIEQAERSKRRLDINYLRDEKKKYDLILDDMRDISRQTF